LQPANKTTDAIARVESSLFLFILFDLIVKIFSRHKGDTLNNECLTQFRVILATFTHCQ